MVEYYLNHPDASAPMGPDVFFYFSDFCLITAAIATGLVWLFWPADRRLAGTGISPE